MLQYLLNTTAIWLLSLLVFDLFLRRETFHNYNRTYLLFTFLLGLALPLIPWHTAYGGYNGALAQQVAAVNSTKAAIVAKATPVNTHVHDTTWLLIVYLAGVLFTLVLLLSEVVKLVNLYRGSHKWKEADWTIVETGRAHSPFSLFRCVFVTGHNNYNSTEWETILLHERQHGKALHFIDVLIMQLSKIVFWFHPLVYIYQHRLLMIHEYQADRVSAHEPGVYGAFLVEQTLLRQAPQIVHSFNRSPIKNRITMLTHHSSPYRHTAKLLILPMMVVFLVCCTRTTYSNSTQPVRNGDVATYRGNKLKFTPPNYDTVIVVDPVTGKQMTKVTTLASVPVTLNGDMLISNDRQDVRASFSAGNLRAYILKQLKTELTALPDGLYNLQLSNIVVDKNGKLAYYEYAGVKKQPVPDMPIMVQMVRSGSVDTVVLKRNKAAQAPANSLQIDKGLLDAINTKFYSVMNNLPSFTPAQNKQFNGNVPVLFNDVNFWNNFKIQDHQLLDFNEDTKDYTPLSMR